ncbi:MAG: protein kinase [Kofleriaceae bacterium]
MRCPRCARRIEPALGCPDHGVLAPAAPATAVLPAPATVPGLAPGTPLATGGSAVVVAIDAVRVVKWGRWRDADLHRRFAHEAAILAAIPAGLGPRCLGHGAVDGWPYVVLERLVGPTVAALLTAPLGAPLALWSAIGAAVARLHAAGVVHGDLKPENLVWCDDRIRLLDFGLAATAAASPPGAAGGGTLHYLAPEVVAGAAATTASDVYALGTIGFELATGRPPFTGERPTIEYGHQLCRPPRAAELAAVPSAVDDLIAACLAKDPRRRPSADAVAATTPTDDAPRRATGTPPAADRQRGPVALVWIEGPDRVALAHIATSRQGRIIRERADGTLAAFTWLDHDAPAEAAIAAARELVRHQARVAIHAAELEVRRRGAAVRMFGPAIERAEAWLPRAPWTGVLATRSVGSPRAGLTDSATFPGFRRLDDDATRARSAVETVPTLCARGGLLGDVAAAITGALDGDRPALVTIVGAPGGGKTRVLDELAAIAAAGPGRVVRIAGALELAGGGSGTAALAAALGDPDVRRGLRAGAAAGLVVLADDAHWLPVGVLDALETAAGWARGRIAVVVAAAPQLLDGRPRWGAATPDAVTFQLPALPLDAARHMLRRLLLPARLIPTPLLDRLAERADGNPAALVAIAGELHHQGIVRCHPDSDEWYVAADELDLAALEPDARWRAARALAALPPGLAELYRLVAQLGARVELPEVEAIQHALPRDLLSIDAGSGLAWLERHAWLRRDGAAWVATSPSLAEAAGTQVAPDVAVAVARAALAYWRAHAAADDELALVRVAHHGAGCGERDVAGRACLTLARRAAGRCHHVEAERWATQAITLLAADAPLAAAAARLERARVRGPLSKFEAARADLAEVIAAARAAGDPALEREALIADAAVCDFADWMAESTAAIEAAAALTSPPPADDTVARLSNWLGVVRLRQHRISEGEALLERARVLADRVGDYPVAVGSRFMLGSLHRRRGQAATGLALVDEALAMARARGDVFHESVGLFNRINYWLALGQPDRAAADCAAAIDQAECHGYGDAEFRGWSNLANLRIQQGDAASARDAARRAYQVARRRFGRHPPVVATLMLAALDAGLDGPAAAADLIAAIDRDEARACAWTSAVLTALELLAAAAPAPAWGPVDAAITAAEPEDRALLAWLRARAA